MIWPLNEVTNDTKTFTEMQTSLQLHLLKSYSNLQKRWLLYSSYIPQGVKFSYIVTEKDTHKNAFPFVTCVKILPHNYLEAKVQRLFCTKEKL